MIVSTEEGLQREIDVVNKVANTYGMKIKTKKTKVMIISRKIGGQLNITIVGKKVEQVSKFKYLGAGISADGGCGKGLKIRIGMAKHTFCQRRALLAKGMCKELKKEFIKTLVWNLLLPVYGAQTWTMTKEDKKRLEDFEMWC